MAKNDAYLIENLIWQNEAGIDECIGDVPMDRFAQKTIGVIEHQIKKFDQEIRINNNDVVVQESNHLVNPSRLERSIGIQPLQEPPQSYGSAPERAILSAIASAGAAKSIPDLRTAVDNFKECTLKNTAMNTVFWDGNPSAKIMFIGTVPGPDEDRKGIPFVGLSGKFLDKIIASINIDRSSCYMANVIFWRPPGDREPTANETAMCIPFVERLIELTLPDIIVLLGGPTAKALLGISKGITKIHGQWFEYSTPKIAVPISAVPLYHPTNLLSSPAYKQDAWRVLLEIKEKLNQK